MVTFQKQDPQFIIGRQATLEEEICTIITEGEELKVYTDPDTRIWFGGVQKTNLAESPLITRTLPTSSTLAILTA
jgi:hypothetical protein